MNRAKREIIKLKQNYKPNSISLVPEKFTKECVVDKRREESEVNASGDVDDTKTLRNAVEQHPAASGLRGVQ
jgi:hypothetical protein